MLTPYSFVMTARIVLVVMVPVTMLLALTSAPRAVFVEGLFFWGLSMLMAQLAIMALPWRRRNDTLKALAIVCATVAALRSGLTGEPSFVVTVPAALIGTVSVWLTLEIEYYRKLARNYGDVGLAVIKIETERRARKQAPADRTAASATSELPSDPAKAL